MHQKVTLVTFGSDPRPRPKVTLPKRAPFLPGNTVTRTCTRHAKTRPDTKTRKNVKNVIRSNMMFSEACIWTRRKSSGWFRLFLGWEKRIRRDVHQAKCWTWNQWGGDGFRGFSLWRTNKTRVALWLTTRLKSITWRVSMLELIVNAYFNCSNKQQIRLWIRIEHCTNE